jgi:eukaryotic-like serine/threonine-protein kinase
MPWAETTCSKTPAHDRTAPGLPPDVVLPFATIKDGDAAALGITRPPASARGPQSLPVGSRVGDYILKDIIARGGFGMVYHAVHAESGASAAVKVLHPELALTSEAVVRFEREIQAIRRIDHPNVIRILAFGELDGGRPYFAMDLLNGMDLEAYMRLCGRLSPEEALSILGPVCEALSQVHKNGMVHRDFKASNVFITDEDGKRRVVLLDFGVAKVLDDAGPGITTPTHILGTPACMAPEQVRGQPADARTDIYALGALLYYMLTGRLPFLDSSLTALLHMHLFVHPPSPSREAPVSPDFDPVVLRAMAKDPDARYQTVEEFLDALRAALVEAHGVPTQLRISLSERRVAALHVEVHADDGAMEDLDDALLADLDEVMALVSRVLTAKGFEATVQTGNTMLLLLDLEASELTNQAARREVVATALDLERLIAQRERRDPRVHVTFCLHAGTVFMRSSKVIGGDLMDLGAWVPLAQLPGVLVTKAMLQGLDIDAEPQPLAPGLSRVRVAPRGCVRTESLAASPAGCA